LAIELIDPVLAVEFDDQGGELLRLSGKFVVGGGSEKGDRSGPAAEASAVRLPV